MDISKSEVLQIEKLLKSENKMIKTLEDYCAKSKDIRLQILYQQTVASHINFFKNIANSVE